MRHNLAIITAFLCCSSAIAQTPAAAPVKISDAYAKAAFLALKAIERDNSTLGAQETKAAIDLADVEASSPEEMQTTKLLRHMAIDKSINNTESRLGGDARIKAIRDREAACFTPLEDGLRAREARFPDACKDLTK